MARSTKLRLRDLWLQVHKWIGLILAILIIPISITGAALVWDEALDRLLHPARYDVVGPPALGPDAYAAAARQVLSPGERIATIRYPEGEGPVVVSAAVASKPGVASRPGPPQRTSVYLDPTDGHVLDKASNNAGLIRAFHMIHGSLMIPGTGRQIVGWVGVAMFVSCLTGLWLWWPVTGSVRRGFRWRRQNSTNANLHHLLGFWILIPLAMLSFTGFWISFPTVFGQGEQRAGGGDRARAFRAKPLGATHLTADAALAAAGSGGRLASISWPTDQAREWKISFERGGGTADASVDDTTAKVTPPRPPRPETLSRTLRRWHDGTNMGPVWQTIIFIGGIIPAILAVTGIIMWLRNRGWRAALAKKRRAKLTPQPAE